jgi:uncharacterized membrane protein
MQDSVIYFNRVDFQAQVPDWLPLSKDLVVLLSGIVETLGLGLAFWKERVTFGWVLALFFVLCFPAILRSTSTKRCFGALNSDSRLIRLFSNRCLLLGPYGQLVRLKPGETTKLKTNMNDAQLKLSSQICFPLYSASRLITKAYKPYLDEMGITYPQYLVLLVLWENDGLYVNQITEKLLLSTNTLSPLLKRMEKWNSYNVLLKMKEVLLCS